MERKELKEEALRNWVEYGQLSGEVYHRGEAKVVAEDELLEALEGSEEDLMRFIQDLKERISRLKKIKK